MKQQYICTDGRCWKSNTITSSDEHANDDLQLRATPHEHYGDRVIVTGEFSTSGDEADSGLDLYSTMIKKDNNEEEPDEKYEAVVRNTDKVTYAHEVLALLRESGSLMKYYNP